MLCALLCTSKSIQAAANHSCQGLLRVRLHERSSRRARQFAGWLRSNIAVVKELYLDLPDYDKKVEEAIEDALLQEDWAAEEEEDAAAADEADNQPGVHLQSYICHTRYGFHLLLCGY